MRKPNYIPKTQVRHNESTNGEYLEEKLRRVVAEKEKIEADVNIPLAYTHRKDGVLAGYDIRTDKFEVARETAQKVNDYKASEWAKGNFVPEVDVPTQAAKDNMFKRNNKPDVGE